MSVLTQIAQRLRGEDDLLAGAIVDPTSGEAGGWEPVEAIREGYLVHYAQPRIVATEDPDLGLLAGDRLYALGLEELAAAGELEAVRTMAGVIADAAAAHAAGDPAGAEQAWRRAPKGAPPASGDR